MNFKLLFFFPLLFSAPALYSLSNEDLFGLILVEINSVNDRLPIMAKEGMEKLGEDRIDGALGGELRYSAWVSDKAAGIPTEVSVIMTYDEVSETDGLVIDGAITNIVHKPLKKLGHIDGYITISGDYEAIMIYDFDTKGEDPLSGEIRLYQEDFGWTSFDASDAVISE